MKKKFKIEEVSFTPEMIAGEEPCTNISYDPIGDYIEADTVAEAMDIAIDWLIDHTDPGYEIVPNDDRTGYDVLLYGELIRRSELTAQEF